MIISVERYKRIKSFNPLYLMKMKCFRYDKKQDMEFKVATIPMELFDNLLEKMHQSDENFQNTIK